MKPNNHHLQLLRRLPLLLLVLVALGVGACEPFAPDSNQQAAVIVITPTATLELLPSPTPPVLTLLPTRPVATSTPEIVNVPLPTLTPCTETTGRVITASLNSNIAGGAVAYRVYVPPCFYQTLRRYPYVILLHGSGYDFTQWTDEIGIQTVLDERLTDPENPLPPMVIVMPEGGLLEEQNQFEAGISFEDFILSELIPEVEKQFCVYTSADGRAIGGISRGGFWAYSIAFRHPEMFSAVGGHSPAFVADNAPTTHNPLDLARSVNPNINLRIWLDNARSDLGGDNVILFSNILREKNIQHIYEISPTGGHDNTYWSEHALQYLGFYGATWSTDPVGLPSCFE